MIEVENNILKPERMSLVKFGAKWCGPCRALQPNLDLIEEEIKDIDIFNVDIDKNEELTIKFGIRSVPAVFLIDKYENILGSFIGIKSKEYIEEMINNRKLDN